MCHGHKIKKGASIKIKQELQNSCQLAYPMKTQLSQKKWERAFLRGMMRNTKTRMQRFLKSHNAVIQIII
jgi:hypothetical protein